MVIYEENTKRIVIPSGLGNLTGLMEAEAQAMYNSGRTDGYNEGVEDGKSIQDRKLTDSVTFNENGEYDADYGYKKVIVDVDNQWDEGYESGYTDGIVSATTIPVEFVLVYNFDDPDTMHPLQALDFKLNGHSVEYEYDSASHLYWAYVHAKVSLYEVSVITSVTIDFATNVPYEESSSSMTYKAITINGTDRNIISYSLTSINQGFDYRIEYTIEPVPISEFQIGYASGYTDGQASCPECSGTTDCSEAVADAFQSGYTNGYASGYTDGEASCPECSGSTDCSEAIAEAYRRGVGEGFIQATANGARVMDMEGTITFDQDTPMDRNFAIHIFMESEGTGYAIIDDYIMIDSTSLHDLKEQGATVSAGTYDFFVAVNEEVRYHDDLDVFRIRGPICSISGVTFDAYLYFSKLA